MASGSPQGIVGRAGGWNLVHRSPSSYTAGSSNGSNSDSASHNHKGDGRFLARSPSTQSLASGSVEWWVIRPPKPSIDAEELDDEEEEEDNVAPPVRLEPSCCGTRPQRPKGSPTSSCQRGLCSPVRRRASRQRHRYIWNGFDLDLAYVTSRVIAMGFPGRGFEAAFRNPQSEVAKFLKQMHGDHYRVYNLCDEAARASNGFPDSVVGKFPCTDHCPPPLRLLLDFCRDAEAWLSAGPENVVAVHCKAGKGRTGSVICALLVFTGAVPSAYHALSWYEWARGGKHSGVTIPAQIRWVAMLERWLRHENMGLSSDAMSLPGDDSAYQLAHVRIGPLAKAGTHVCSTVLVRVGLASRAAVARKEVSWCRETPCQLTESNCVEVSLPSSGPVWQEIDGLLLVRAQWPGGKLKAKVWWHHAFLQRMPDGGLQLQVTKEWLDGLHKDIAKDRLVPPNFRLAATFQDGQTGNIFAV